MTKMANMRYLSNIIKIFRNKSNVYCINYSPIIVITENTIYIYMQLLQNKISFSSNYDYFIAYFVYFIGYYYIQFCTSLILSSFRKK